MSTIRRGSTQSGKLVIGPAEPITPVNLNPVPPPMTAKATIESFQTPVTLGHAAQVKAKVTQGHPDKFRWQYLTGGSWKTAGEVPATSLTYEYLFPAVGQYPIRLQSMVAGNVTDTTGTPRTIVVLKNPDPPPVDLRTGLLAWVKKYITAEGGGDPTGTLHAIERDQPQRVGPWETFLIGNGMVQTETGWFWTVKNGIVYANGTAFDPATMQFEFVKNGNGTVSLRHAGLWVTCETDGSITCNRPIQGEWEQFKLAAPGTVLPVPPPPGTVTRVHPDGHVFRDGNNAAWRWKGVSAFQLCDRWLRGEDLTPFLSAYQGYNLLRVWSYTEGPNWTDPAWSSPDPQEAVAFVKEMNRLGWYVEWTLLTSSNKARLPMAQAQIQAFTAANLTGLFLEGSNEPEVQNPDSTFIDCAALKHDLEVSGYPYTNGCYTEGAKRWWGTYFTCHTARTSEWPRYCHDGYDYWVKPADAPAGAQAVHAPCIFDEPAKTQDVSGDKVSDWKAYFGGCSFFGAGATFHSKTGKFAQPPTAEEAQLAAAALVGMGAFPADAPAHFDYQRISDNTLRTYRMGNAMVRIRPTTLQAPQSGWTMIDSAGILWRR